MACRGRLALGAFVALGLAGCSGETTQQTATATGGTPDAGTPGCAAGEMPLADGGCQPPGVPADGCATGFVSDGATGCRAILPDAPCAAGTMAIPGETACRPVAPCGNGTWGDIPVEATTEYVDAAYTGGSSDGSSARPWTTIQTAIDAAAANAVIAIAAGTYAEDVFLDGKSVRLWGVCPDRVTIAGAGGTGSTLAIELSGADSAEVHDLAIRGVAVGVEIGGAQGPLLDRVWIHDTGSAAIGTANGLGPGAFKVTRSLVERASNLGIYISGSDATIEESVVRDTQPDPTGHFGTGVAARDYPATAHHATVTMRASLLERNQYSGMHVSGSEATVDACVIRDTQPQKADAVGGRGINVQSDAESNQRATITLRGSLLEGNREMALFASGSDATLERVTLRNTQRTLANEMAADGRAIDVQKYPEGNAGAHLSVVESSIAGSDGVGVFLGGCEATIERTAIRDTTSRALDGVSGRGLEVRNQGSAVVRYTTIERNQQVGVFAEGSQLELDSCAIRDTTPQTWDQTGGFGLAVEKDMQNGTRSSLSAKDCLIERNVAAGAAAFDSDAVLASTVLRDIAAQPNGLFGDGLIAGGTTNLTVSGVRIEACGRAGLSNFGGVASLQALTSECNPIHLDGEPFDGAAPTFMDEGQNVCGCKGKIVACQIASSALQAPDPLPPSVTK